MQPNKRLLCRTEAPSLSQRQESPLSAANLLIRNEIDRRYRHDVHKDRPNRATTMYRRPISRRVVAAKWPYLDIANLSPTLLHIAQCSPQCWTRGCGALNFGIHPIYVPFTDTYFSAGLPLSGIAVTGLRRHLAELLECSQVSR